jgi:hypothetical protein
MGGPGWNVLLAEVIHLHLQDQFGLRLTRVPDRLSIGLSTMSNRQQRIELGWGRRHTCRQAPLLRKIQLVEEAYISRIGVKRIKPGILAQPV